MKTLKEVLAAKRREPAVVAPDATVYQAIELMASRDVGAVAVLDEAGRLVGFFSERDYTRKVILRGRASRDTRVREIMSTEVVAGRPEQTVDEAMRVMTGRKIRHIPVLENEKLLGIVSILDVVEAVISDQAFTIQYLEGYISGAPAV